MSTEIVFETHSWSVDNEQGIASGWLPGRLSERGRELATRLGHRRRNDRIAAVFTSDLRRVVQTADLALTGTDLPVLHDWRLRECDYGFLNGAPAAGLHANRMSYLDQPYPGGESWRQAVQRVRRVLADLPTTAFPWKRWWLVTSLGRKAGSTGRSVYSSAGIAPDIGPTYPTGAIALSAAMRVTAAVGGRVRLILIRHRR